MCKRSYSDNSSSPHKKSSQFTYDYEGDDPDLWTPPRKKRNTKTVQKQTHDLIIEIDTGKLTCDDHLCNMHSPTNPSLFYYCH